MIITELDLVAAPIALELGCKKDSTKYEASENLELGANAIQLDLRFYV